MRFASHVNRYFWSDGKLARLGCCHDSPLPKQRIALYENDRDPLLSGFDVLWESLFLPKARVWCLRCHIHNTEFAASHACQRPILFYHSKGPPPLSEMEVYFVSNIINHTCMRLCYWSSLGKAVLHHKECYYWIFLKIWPWPCFYVVVVMVPTSYNDLISLFVSGTILYGVKYINESHAMPCGAARFSWSFSSRIDFKM